jgi:hypothetical protein
MEEKFMKILLSTIEQYLGLGADIEKSGKIA